jgi:hypothetical protein
MEEFNFEDADVEVRPMVTTPLPGHGDSRLPSASASLHPLPGTLFGGSPRPVASGVTRGEKGEKKEESRVRLVHVSDPNEICGGAIGAVENKKFCTAHPSECEHQLHAKRKLELKPDTLYVMSSKKGAMHATLLPKLDVHCIPEDKALVDLLNDERPVAMWHVYFDGCNTVEEVSGANELDAPTDLSWEAVDRPSLEDLERANDFKTPRKVRVMPGFVEQIVTYKMETLGEMAPLDLSDLPPISGAPSTSQKAVRQMFEGWDVIKDNFILIWSRISTDDEQAKGEMSGLRAQLQESIDYLNDIGAKARLLSAKIGRNPKAEAEGDTTIWEALSELSHDLKHVKTVTSGFTEGIRTITEHSQKQDVETKRMGENMSKLYSHYKNNLGTANNRMIAVERQISGLRNAPMPQAQEGDFDFGTNMAAPSNGSTVQTELQELREEIAELKKERNGDQPSSNSKGVFPAASQEEILARLKAVETRGSTGVTCVLGGTTFTSEADIRSYITTHEIPSCALYWDLFSIMVCMGAKGLTGKERSDRIYSAERGRTGSALEGELVASMSHKRPLCLYGEGSKLARLDEGFAMCKTYDQWIGSGNQESYRQELSTQILVYTNGILGQIGAPSTPAHHLAQVLLNQVGMQWNAVIGFIDMFYLELVAKAKFDSGKAWKLVAVCVAAIFEAAQPYRAKVILLEDSTRVDQKAAFMWAIFQTHRVIDSFISVQFKSHPAIVKEISLFMVTERVDPKEVLDLSVKCKKAESDAAKAVADMKKLSEAHNELKRKHESLHADFKLVKAKVK